MRKGFTIVELLIAMALFVIIISIASGAFINSLRTQRATVALVAANSNASLALEQMAREMRTGKDFSQSAAQEITFTNANGESATYQWNNISGAVEKKTGSGSFKRITADNVLVKNLNFRIFNGSLADPYPPRITVVLQVAPANIPFIDSTVDLETTVSARLP